MTYMRAVADVDEDLPLILGCSLDDIPAPHRYNHAVIKGFIWCWIRSLQPIHAAMRALGKAGGHAVA
jgi:hypothetical protein